MRILRIEIEEFGKLANREFVLGEGINLFEGANESGKSTLLAFLRFAFYGFPRKGGADGEEREKRLSWKTHRVAGKLYLENEQGEFCIFRAVTRQGNATRESFSEQLCVTALPRGEEIELAGKTPGEYFMGLPATLYDATLCLRQSDAERVCAADVGESVGELLFSGSAGVGADAAMDRLQAARRALLHQKGRGGRIAELEDRIAQGESMLARASEEQEKLLELQQTAARYRAQVGERRAQLEEITAAFEQASIAQSLALFADVHAAEQVQEQKKLTAEAIAARNAAKKLPTPEQVAQAQLALRQRALAIEAGARMTPELERMRGIRYNSDMVAAHATVTEKGGAERVLADFSKAQKRRKGARITAIVCLLLTVFFWGLLALVATGVLAPLWQLLPVGTYLPLVCLALLALGGLSLLLCCLFAILSLRARRRLRAWQKTLHVTHLSMFRTYLEQCAAEAKAQQTHRAVLATLEGEYSATAEQVLAAEARVRPLLLDAGFENSPDLFDNAPECLDRIEQMRTADEQELANARMEAERATAALEALRRPLAGQSEARLRARFKNQPTENADELRRRQAFLHESITGLEQKRAEAERREHALAATLQKPDELRAQLEQLRGELANARRQLDAVLLACEALGEATETLQKGITPHLCEEASSIFCQLTGGAYTALHPGTDFSVMLDCEAGLLPLSHFSAGCRDAACLALRLGLVSTLCNEQPPLLFDEALARLDDERAASLLEVLERHAYRGGQCLLFTCHSREAKLLASGSYQRFQL